MPWPLTKVEGPSAYMRAAATICSAGTPVIEAATSGGYCAALSASASKPWQRLATNALS